MKPDWERMTWLVREGAQVARKVGIREQEPADSGDSTEAWSLVGCAQWYSQDGTKQLSGWGDQGTKAGRRQQTCKSWIRKFLSLLLRSQISEAQTTETRDRLQQTGLPGRTRSSLPREPESVIPGAERPWPRETGQRHHNMRTWLRQRSEVKWG